ncbi:hypothetical protein ACX27_13710 [Nostoc piscinale CENA21]|uniref:Uncharacterized protein n=1 Tax=Nostoc piscinale CENA21 TaxID=224013 RepID=A0A0M5MH47_9NOSO|nr:hypothetical protein ACX27_13710 [Nostoc piscinale CENA21]
MNVEVRKAKFQAFCSKVGVRKAKFQAFYSKVGVRKTKFQPFCSKVGVRKAKFQPFCSKVGVLRVKVEVLRWKCQEIFCVGCCGMGDFFAQRRRGAERNKRVLDFLTTALQKVLKTA